MKKDNKTVMVTMPIGTTVMKHEDVLIINYKGKKYSVSEFRSVIQSINKK